MKANLFSSIVLGSAFIFAPISTSFAEDSAAEKIAENMSDEAEFSYEVSLAFAAAMAVDPSIAKLEDKGQQAMILGLLMAVVDSDDLKGDLKTAVKTYVQSTLDMVKAIKEKKIESKEAFEAYLKKLQTEGGAVEALLKAKKADPNEISKLPGFGDDAKKIVEIASKMGYGSEEKAPQDPEQLIVAVKKVLNAYDEAN